jgi:predicted alpha/beta superfamily hydrolase
MNVIKKEIFITELNRKAKLYIGLPDDYQDSDEHYPVLYMHDGHNVFFEEDSYAGTTWGMLEAYRTHLDLPKIIVVGLECAQGLERLNEYGPYPFEINVFEELGSTPGGKGQLYLDYLAYVLKPEIDQTYRTKKEPIHTAIMGSSMGAVISLYAACKYKDTFTRFGCVSGSYFVSFEALKTLVKETDLSHVKKLYMDIGDDEVGGGDSADYIVTNTVIYEMLAKKLDQFDLYFELIAGGKHHESDWAARLPNILRFLFSE